VASLPGTELCGTCGDTCNCRILGDSHIQITGSGTAADPYVTEFLGIAYDNAGSVGISFGGLGTDVSPLIATALPGLGVRHEIDTAVGALTPRFLSALGTDTAESGNAAWTSLSNQVTLTRTNATAGVVERLVLFLENDNTGLFCLELHGVEPVNVVWGILLDVDINAVPFIVGQAIYREQNVQEPGQGLQRIGIGFHRTVDINQLLVGEPEADANGYLLTGNTVTVRARLAAFNVNPVAGLLVDGSTPNAGSRFVQSSIRGSLLIDQGV
jgi:hypothetical protein